jgi:hypothetical protein
MSQTQKRHCEEPAGDEAIYLPGTDRHASLAMTSKRERSDEAIY